MVSDEKVSVVDQTRTDQHLSNRTMLGSKLQPPTHFEGTASSSTQV
jgi:hypothetical protein